LNHIELHLIKFPIEQHQLPLSFFVKHGLACLIYRIAHLSLIFGENDEKETEL